MHWHPSLNRHCGGARHTPGSTPRLPIPQTDDSHLRPLHRLDPNLSGALLAQSTLRRRSAHTLQYSYLYCKQIIAQEDITGDQMLLWCCLGSWRDNMQAVFKDQRELGGHLWPEKGYISVHFHYALGLDTQKLRAIFRARRPTQTRRPSLTQIRRVCCS
jgi:hypothetical protein